MHKNTPDKKAISLEIKNQLTQSLGHLKELLGEKKFHNRIDEAVKLFTKGLKKLEHHKEQPVEKKKPTAVTSKTREGKEVVKKEKQKDEAAPKAVVAPKKQSAPKATGKASAKSDQ